MHDVIWMNGRILRLAEARVSPASAGALYGWGVFTTLGIAASRPRAFGAHWERLVAHAGRVHVEVAWERDEVADGLEGLLEVAGVRHGRARVTLLRASAGLWVGASERESDAVVFVAERPSAERAPIALTVSPFRLSTTSPLAGVKATAYVDHLLALEEARGRSFDEAILLNERGEIVEATAANVFWARDGELFTPALATGCVAGVTRRFVLAEAARRRIRVTEASHPLTAIGEADEVFLTNSGWGLVPVKQFDIHAYPAPGPMVTLLARDVDAAVAAST
jgi:branched-subunit amino acid aminotransferase/4-amino-4-deoxychorismate lyase